MLKVKEQLSKLYLYTLFGNLSLSGAWVAILAARGFSLVEIGIAETIFHITSILFEIPSGALADVLGRKRMLLVSAAMRVIGDIAMILSWNFPVVCISLMFYALSYNFASGTDDALAYDSLKMAGEEVRFEKYNSNQMILYRLCNGISTLCAGIAFIVGYKIAYGTGAITGMIQIIIVLSLNEIKGADRRADHGAAIEIINCFQKSFHFLYIEKQIAAYMIYNSFVGAVDILLLFFLEAKLTACGLPKWALGSALLFMQMGGVIGAKLILRLKKWSYRKIAVAMGILVISGFMMEHTGISLIMTLGGFLSAFGDDALQIRTNAKIQSMAPSEQRATITSVESFLFSLIMIVLSPVTGFVFSAW
ncbi:MAG: MFS transporter [Clostridiales bacterium]|nr:MFS transporter [Clostridiales bacterium]